MNAIALPITRPRVFILVLLFVLGGTFATAAAQPDPPENLLQKCWETITPSPVVVGMGYDSSVIYISSDDGSVRAVNITRGDQLWSAELGGAVSSNFLTNESNVFVVSRPIPESTGVEKQVSVLRSISKQTGVTNWSSKIPISDKTYLLDGGSGFMIAAGSDGAVTAVSQDNGKIIWSITIAGKLTGRPDIRNERIALATTQNDVYIISNTDGMINKRLQMKFLPTSMSITEDGNFLVGDQRGNLALIGKKSGDTIWKFKNGARISHAVETERGILASSYDNFVYLLTAGSGAMIWKRRLSGRISDAPVILGDMVFVRISGDKQAYLISLKNGKIVQKIEIGESDAVGQASLSAASSAIIIGGSSGVALYGLRSCPAK